MWGKMGGLVGILTYFVCFFLLLWRVKRKIYMWKPFNLVKPEGIYWQITLYTSSTFTKVNKEMKCFCVSCVWFCEIHSCDSGDQNDSSSLVLTWFQFILYIVVYCMFVYLGLLIYGLLDSHWKWFSYTGLIIVSFLLIT